MFFLYFVISGFLFITFGGFNVNRFAFVFKVQLLLFLDLLLFLFKMSYFVFVAFVVFEFFILSFLLPKIVLVFCR